MTQPERRPAEAIARQFHDEYEYLAMAYGYETRRESAVEWENVPEQNRKLMIHVVANLLAQGVITPRQVAPIPPQAQATDCGQCGQRTPVCVDCGDSIIFMPKSGFGMVGEWRHLAPPRVQVGPHMPRPKVFVDPPIRTASQETTDMRNAG